MTVLIVGASGATGRLVVNQLLKEGQRVRVIVRSPQSIDPDVLNQPGLEVIAASLLDLSDDQLRKYVRECGAIVSCLGHNISWKGIYGHPRRLVTEATRRLCQAVKSQNADEKVKYVLMNTTGNRNRDLNEPIPLSQRIVIGILRMILPPHPDNEQAAEYLRSTIGQKDPHLEWVVVRPDGLTDEEAVTPYDLHPSPVRNPIFNAGQTSRINVANFMVQLVLDTDRWTQWIGRMPVIYNQESGLD